MTKLQILICTIGDEGIRRVENGLHPSIEGVEYLVAWQQPDGSLPIPESLECRNDFRFKITATRGISRNRNIAIDAASAPICLMGDDDIDYDSSEIEALIELFDKHPETDLFTLRYRSHPDFPKFYPEHEFDLRKPPKGYYVTAFEIAFRTDAIRDKVRFNENISIGTPVLRCGEEDIFIHDVRKAGIPSRFFPLTVGTHNHPTTAGRDRYEPYFLMTKGAIFSYVHSRTWLPRLCVNAYREFRATGFNPFKYLKFTLKGIRYARRNRIFK